MHSNVCMSKQYRPNLLRSNHKLLCISNSSAGPFAFPTITSISRYNMYMYVWNYLVGCSAIILTYTETISMNRRNNSLRNCGYDRIKLAYLRGSHREQTFMMRSWNDKAMSMINGVFIHQGHEIFILIDYYGWYLIIYYRAK
jgi:hypothetical protein